jgi:hypothetical protein
VSGSHVAELIKSAFYRLPFVRQRGSNIAPVLSQEAGLTPLQGTELCAPMVLLEVAIGDFPIAR